MTADAQPNDANREPIGQLLRQHGPTLLQLAMASIEHGLEHARPVPVSVGEFAEPLRGEAASFVTLKTDGRLRGCIGTIDAHRSLVEDVAENGYAAAFRDTRFPRLQADECAMLQISVSVLSAPQPLAFGSETELLALLRPGSDGLIIRSDGRRAVFLPQVWEQLPLPRTFLVHLKEKAGLPADHWSRDFRAWRFSTASVATEAPPAPA
jgi:AmmeMemoRadiSam system protein A